MNTSQRQDIVSKEAKSLPGPGNYDSPERFGKEGQSVRKIRYNSIILILVYYDRKI